jgi:hypothetical protein
LDGYLKYCDIFYQKLNILDLFLFYNNFLISEVTSCFGVVSEFGKNRPLNRLLGVEQAVVSPAAICSFSLS